MTDTDSIQHLVQTKMKIEYYFYLFYRMIDFAHVFEEPKSDENYIFGLRNLIKNFKLILKSL